MLQINNLEVLLDELSRRHFDNGTNILVIDGVAEQAGDYIESINHPLCPNLIWIKATALTKLGEIPVLVKEYKNSFKKTVGFGDPAIYLKCVSDTEDAISVFIKAYLDLKLNNPLPKA